MRRPPPPRDEPPRRRLRRDLPRPEGPFDRLLRRRPERDPAPIIIGGTIAFLAIVIVLVFAFSALLGGGDGGDGGIRGGNGSFDVGVGVTGRRGNLPGLPPGLQAVSEFVEFEAEDEDEAKIIALPLKERIEDPAGLGFYTFFENRWQRLADAQLFEEGRVAEGDFPSVPDNLAVLRVIGQTYQAIGSLPPGGSLHSEARVSIVSPRDYAPADDGSVQGQATQVAVEEGVLIIPTIVGSGEDTAAVVNQILGDDSLRDQHIQSILTLVNESADVDGIDLEYSSVDPSLEPQFTDFVNELAEGLHSAGKQLSLTLPPPTDEKQAYDWEKIGEQVNIVRILPIADPTSYWKEMPGGISDIVKQVDPRKVVLVVSPFSVEVGGSARPIGFQQAMALAAESVVREPGNPEDIKPGATVKLVARNLDAEEGGSPLRWEDDAAALTFALGGTERKRLYIENPFSVSFKLELVQAYGLGGVAVSDASGQTDVANIWPAINELVSSATVSLRRPNDNMLLPVWLAPDGGDLGAGAGTTVTWIPRKEGPHKLILVVSDGIGRFGRETAVEVKKGTQPSTTPIRTFGADTPTPAPTPAPTATPTPGPSSVSVEVGLRADGDGDINTDPSNNETATPGSEITYFVWIDNDSPVAVTITSLVDNVYGEVECKSSTSNLNAIGIVLDPDTGDGPGEIDGGLDEVLCTFKEKAPDQPNKTVVNIVTGTVRDENSNEDSDSDDTLVQTTNP